MAKRLQIDSVLSKFRVLLFHTTLVVDMYGVAAFGDMFAICKLYIMCLLHRVCFCRVCAIYRLCLSVYLCMHLRMWVFCIFSVPLPSLVTRDLPKHVGLDLHSLVTLTVTQTLLRRPATLSTRPQVSFATLSPSAALPHHQQHHCPEPR